MIPKTMTRKTMQRRGDQPTMAVEVRIPTILRPYTGGEKAVDGSGGTLDELFSDLDSRHPGLRERLVEEGQLRRFVNVYLNDEDVRFLGGLATELSDGDDVTILPAVAGGSSAGTARRRVSVANEDPSVTMSAGTARRRVSVANEDPSVTTYRAG